MNRYDNDYMIKFDKLMDFFAESKVRVITSVLVVAFSILLCFFFSNAIIKALEMKIPFEIELLQLYVHEVFLNNLKIGIFTGTFISMPFLIYQFSKLKIKNLTKENKTKLIKIVSAVFGTCIIGVLTAYYIAIPLQLFFLIGINTELSSLTLNLSAYIAFCLSTIIINCFIFLLPLIYFLLKKNLFFSSQELDKIKKPMLYVSGIMTLLILSPPEILAFCILSVLIYLFYIIIVNMVRKFKDKV